jgi:hypothetical protein
MQYTKPLHVFKVLLVEVDNCVAIWKYDIVLYIACSNRLVMTDDGRYRYRNM